MAHPEFKDGSCFFFLLSCFYFDAARKPCYNFSMNQVLKEHKFPSGRVFQLVKGDLTDEDVDAIVNAANERLAHGGGVAGAIARKGGSEIQEESTRWVKEHGPVSHAMPAYTSAGRLTCRYVIHAVGPVWGDGGEDAKLEAAVSGSLKRAEQLGLSSVALPAISTGIFGFPKDRAAGIIYRTVCTHLTGSPGSLRRVRLVIFDRPTLDVFEASWEAHFPDYT
jgi:O-acetyl-ADP-ribose deacetylase